MARRSVDTDQKLRQLLRAGRRASGNLSQRSAAQRARISPVYWQKIESGALSSAPEGTLAAMFLSVEISAERLRDEGYDDLARAMDELGSVTIAPPDPEDYLASTPGASKEEISALQAVWRALRAERTPDPFGPGLNESRHQDHDERDGETGQQGLKPASNQA